MEDESHACSVGPPLTKYEQLFCEILELLPGLIPGCCSKQHEATDDEATAVSPMKDTARSIPVPSGEALGGQPLLLLVEDDLDDRALFQRALHKAGVACPIVCVEEAVTAIETLAQLGPDITSVCLVSDSKLADMSGLELLKRVRKMALPVPVKFAFLTGNSHPLIACRAHEFGADAFFSKPCASDDLIGIATAIARLLSDASPLV